MNNKLCLPVGPRVAARILNGCVKASICACASLPVGRSANSVPASHCSALTASHVTCAQAVLLSSVTCAVCTRQARQRGWRSPALNPVAQSTQLNTEPAVLAALVPDLHVHHHCTRAAATGGCLDDRVPWRGCINAPNMEPAALVPVLHVHPHCTRAAATGGCLDDRVHWRGCTIAPKHETCCIRT